MQIRSRVVMSLLGLALVAIMTYRLAPADDGAAGELDNITNFNGLSCLVVFELGSDGIDRTVLVDASITQVGGKQFLRGEVTDKFPDVQVAMPGKVALVALDRVAYIQILGDAKRADVGR